MGTTQKTAQSGTFDPQSMESFHTLLSGLTPMLGGYMANPFGNPFFQQQQQMGTRQAANLGQTGMSNITRNLTASGLGGAPAGAMAGLGGRGGGVSPEMGYGGGAGSLIGSGLFGPPPSPGGGMPFWPGMGG